LAALLEDTGVDHGGGDIVVAEQLLEGADVGAEERTDFIKKFWGCLFQILT